MNAKEELVRHIADNKIKSRIIAMRISREINWDEREDAVSYDAGDDFEVAINHLDFEYDSGYGGQELYGTIWYEDGTWSERDEYDGSEWWEYRSCPEIPPKDMEV